LQGFSRHAGLAFIAYVSNEKSNTFRSSIPTNGTVTRTIRWAAAARHRFTRDGKFVLVAAAMTTRSMVIDAATQQVVDSLPSGPDPELFTQDAAGKILYVAKRTQHGNHHRSRKARPRRRHPGRRRA